MKKIVSIFLVVILTLTISVGALPIFASAAGEEVRAAKKIISVVYDDSGSMAGDRWVYANYAMQALTAQLNSQDELYITYMSEPGKATSVSLKDLNKAVTDIRNHKKTGGTPGESLKTAYNKLKKVSGQEPSTQYWLVIMTDGGINGLSSTLQATLDSYKGNQMDNGATLNVVYFSMVGGEKISGNPSAGLHAYHANNPAEITTVMSDISKLVSGRIPVDNPAQVNSKTISFTSKLPLYSFSVLSQQSTATVTAAKTDKEDLTVDRNIPLDSSYSKSKVKLIGNASVINKQSSGVARVIPAGTYTVTFSEEVDVKNLVIQYEPAIGLKMTITKDGKEVTDPSTLAIDDKVDIEITPIIPGTDTKIDSADLPANLSWTTEYIVDDKVIGSAAGTTLKDVSIKNGKNILRGTMQIPGFAPSIYEIPFDVAKIVYNLGIDVDQPNPLNYNRKGMGKGSVEGTSVAFHLTHDGNPLSKEEQISSGLGLSIAEVKCDNSGVKGFLHRIGNILAECELVMNDDGSYTLVPKSGFFFTSFLMKAGLYSVKVCATTDDTVTAVGTFTVVPSYWDWIDFLIWLIILLILIYIIYLIQKPKFSGQTVSSKTYEALGRKGIEVMGSSTSKTLNVFDGLFNLKAASEAEFKGLTIRAVRGGGIVITGKSIAKKVAYYGASESDPINSFRSVLGGMISTKRNVDGKTKKAANDQTLSAAMPIYFRSSETSQSIWYIKREGNH